MAESKVNLGVCYIVTAREIIKFSQLAYQAASISVQCTQVRTCACIAHCIRAISKSYARKESRRRRRANWRGNFTRTHVSLVEQDKGCSNLLERDVIFTRVLLLTRIRYIRKVGATPQPSEREKERRRVKGENRERQVTSMHGILV